MLYLSGYQILCPAEYPANGKLVIRPNIDSHLVSGPIPGWYQIPYPILSANFMFNPSFVEILSLK